jgi:hypothetical protein
VSLNRNDMLHRLKALPGSRLAELVFHFRLGDTVPGPPTPKTERAIALIEAIESLSPDAWQELESLVQPRAAVGVVAGQVTSRLVQDLEQAMNTRELQESRLAPVVLAEVRQETRLRLAEGYTGSALTAAIRLSDEYFVRIAQSAGVRDWQRDFAQAATPLLVGLARSLQRSADAQALVIRVCEAVAGELRLELIWPRDANEHNDLKNSIYGACVAAAELESDEVLCRLKRLEVVGPR